MNREKAIEQIGVIAAEQVLNEHEVLEVYRAAMPVESRRQSAPLTDIVSYLGALIAAAGVAVLIGTSWDDLSDAVKIASTLGLAVLCYSLGMFLETKQQPVLTNSVQVIGAVTFPIGLLVTMFIGGISPSNPYYQLIPALLLTLLYGATWLSRKKLLYLFFFIVFATWLYGVLGALLMTGMPIDSFFQYFFYVPASAGLTYLLLGRALSTSEHRGLTSPLYAFGSFALLLFGLLLTDFSRTILVLEIAYPLLLAGVIYLSTLWQARALLVFGIGFTLAYLIAMTAEHFSEVIGWPLALILIGFIMIGVGSFGVRLNRRFFSKKQPVTG